MSEGQNDQKRTKTQILDHLPRVSKISVDNRGKSHNKIIHAKPALMIFYHHA